MNLAFLSNSFAEAPQQTKLLFLGNKKTPVVYLDDGIPAGVVVDYLVGSYVLAENKIRNIKVVGAPIVSSSSSIAVRKGNAALPAEINRGLQVIKAEGTAFNSVQYH